jgi:hypothetical protein
MCKLVKKMTATIMNQWREIEGGGKKREKRVLYRVIFIVLQTDGGNFALAMEGRRRR